MKVYSKSTIEITTGRPRSAERVYLETMVTPKQLQATYHLEGLRFTASSLGVTPWLLLRVIDDWDIPRLGNANIAPRARVRMCKAISIFRRRSVNILARELRESLKKPLPNYYPFISGNPQNEQELVMVVNEAVPKNLSEDYRQDICQDLLVALLEHQIEIADLKEATPEFIKRNYKFFPPKYRPLSLDAPPPWWKNEDKKALAEMISEEGINSPF